MYACWLDSGQYNSPFLLFVFSPPAHNDWYLSPLNAVLLNGSFNFKATNSTTFTSKHLGMPIRSSCQPCSPLWKDPNIAIVIELAYHGCVYLDIALFHMHYTCHRLFCPVVALDSRDHPKHLQIVHTLGDFREAVLPALPVIMLQVTRCMLDPKGLDVAIRVHGYVSIAN